MALDADLVDNGLAAPMQLGRRSARNQTKPARHADERKCSRVPQT
jgi:hypothetical protein